MLFQLLTADIKSLCLPNPRCPAPALGDLRPRAPHDSLILRAGSSADDRYIHLQAMGTHQSSAWNPIPLQLAVLHTRPIRTACHRLAPPCVVRWTISCTAHTSYDNSNSNLHSQSGALADRWTSWFMASWSSKNSDENCKNPRRALNQLQPSLDENHLPPAIGQSS